MLGKGRRTTQPDHARSIRGAVDGRRAARRKPARTLLVAAALAATSLAPAAASAATYPPGFSERTVFSGLTNPTAVRFASDGRVFVAEKSG